MLWCLFLFVRTIRGNKLTKKQKLFLMVLLCTQGRFLFQSTSAPLSRQRVTQRLIRSHSNSADRKTVTADSFVSFQHSMELKMSKVSCCSLLIMCNTNYIAWVGKGIKSLKMLKVLNCWNLSMKRIKFCFVCIVES